MKKPQSYCLVALAVIVMTLAGCGNFYELDDDGTIPEELIAKWYATVQDAENGGVPPLEFTGYGKVIVDGNEEYTAMSRGNYLTMTQGGVIFGNASFKIAGTTLTISGSTLSDMKNGSYYKK